MKMNARSFVSAAVSLALAASLAVPACAEDTEKEAPKKITFCLDWTPNTNHTGVYAAQALGYYEEAGLDVSIVQPPENGATLMCAAGQAQFAVDAQDTMAASLDLEEASPQSRPCSSTTPPGFSPAQATASRLRQDLQARFIPHGSPPLSWP